MRPSQHSQARGAQLSQQDGKHNAESTPFGNGLYQECGHYSQDSREGPDGTDTFACTGSLCHLFTPQSNVLCTQVKGSR